MACCKRRKAGASQAAELGLPTTKTPGWEFTDLAELAEEDFATPNGSADPDARSRADAVLNPPESAPSASSRSTARRRATRCPPPPRRPRRPPNRSSPPSPTPPTSIPRWWPRSSGRWPPPTTPSSPATTPPGRAARSSTSPRASASPTPAQIAAVHDTDGAAIGFRTLIVLEEGAEAEVWEQWLATDHERRGLFNTVTEIFVGPAATLHYVTAQGLGANSWVFATQQRRGRARRHARLGRARLRLGARQGAHGDAARPAPARAPR